MQQPDWKRPLEVAKEHALAYLDGLPERPVDGRASLRELRAALGGPLPEETGDPSEVVEALARVTLRAQRRGCG